MKHDSEKRGYLRICYTQKWRENDQEEDSEPDGLIKQKGYINERKKLRRIFKEIGSEEQRFLCDSQPIALETTWE